MFDVQKSGFLFLGISMAHSELAIAMTAARVNKVPTPYSCHIQPPKGAAAMETRWFMDKPVVRVEVTLSLCSSMLLT
jgi:hypothetical protein